MPRGSRPGERRGGRQRGTPNKKTLLKNAVFLAAAGGGPSAEPNRLPLDFMLALMRDPQVPLKDRVDMAIAAAPFVHARPRKPSREPPHPMELRARAAKAAAQNGAANGGPAGPSLQPALPDGAEQAALVGGGEAVVVGLAGAGPQAIERFDIRLPSPLDFLLAVMADPEAAPKERMRAAQVAARFKHRLADDEEAGPVEDEFGFKIDPQLAIKIQQIAGACDSLAQTSGPSPADIQKHKTLLKELREQTEKIGCAPAYNWAALRGDQERLAENAERRRGRQKLSADEIAEETYRIARMEVYRATPQHEAWCRISGLEVKRAQGHVLTEAEINEIAILSAAFPSIAQHFANRKWSHYNWEVLATVEEYRRRRRGLTPDDIKEKDKRRGEALFERQERATLSERQIGYLENKPKPVVVTRAHVEQWRESKRAAEAGVPTAENERP